MAIQANIQAGFTAVSTSVRALRTLITGTATGTLAGLFTTDKTSVVNAINEDYARLTTHETTSFHAGINSSGVIRATADTINASAVANTLVAASGLVVPVVAGSWYHFRFVVTYTAQAVSVGSRWVLTGPTFTTLSYTQLVPLGVASSTINNGAAYNNPGVTSASSATTGGNLMVTEGLLLPSAAGNLGLSFASELASQAITAKVGSFVEWRRLT
jgi:hypothetical protein